MPRVCAGAGLERRDRRMRAQTGTLLGWYVARMAYACAGRDAAGLVRDPDGVPVRRPGRCGAGMRLGLRMRARLETRCAAWMRSGR